MIRHYVIIALMLGAVAACDSSDKAGSANETLEAPVENVKGVDANMPAEDVMQAAQDKTEDVMQAAQDKTEDVMQAVQDKTEDVMQAVQDKTE